MIVFISTGIHFHYMVMISPHYLPLSVIFVTNFLLLQSFPCGLKYKYPPNVESLRPKALKVVPNKDILILVTLFITVSELMNFKFQESFLEKLCCHIGDFFI